MSAALFCDDPRDAIAWLCRAFGLQVRIIVDGPDDAVLHSELEYGEAVIMVAGVGASHAREGQTWRERLASPSMVGGKVTCNLAIYVDDVDAHCETARRAGAQIVSEPTTVDYGPDHWSDRNYAALDCEGHLWWFMQRLSTKGVPHGA